MESLIRELQLDALNRDVSVPDLLRIGCRLGSLTPNKLPTKSNPDIDAPYFAFLSTSLNPTYIHLSKLVGNSKPLS